MALGLSVLGAVHGGRRGRVLLADTGRIQRRDRHRGESVRRARRRSSPARGYGTRTAIEYAQEAERLGADGLLLMPPYLVEASQEGLRAHITAICRATKLGVIVYNRANCRLAAATTARLAADCPEPDRLQGRRRRSRTARRDARRGRRPAALHQRHADGGDLRGRVPGRRRRDLFVGGVQLHPAHRAEVPRRDQRATTTRPSTR